MKLFYITLLIFFVSGTLAETSEQYKYRAEFFFGNITEGNTYEDVKSQNMEYLKFLKENDLKYGRALFVPIWAGETEYDIIEYGWWPNGQEQYKEWGAYMNDYPAWAEENSAFEGQLVETQRSISMRGVRARGIRIPEDERDRFKFVDFRRCTYKTGGNLENILEIHAKVEANEIEMGNRDGYGEHIFTPYRGIESDIGYDFVVMRHYYSAKKRSDIISSFSEFRKMMADKGFFDEFRNNATCGPLSTFRVEWLYYSGSD